MSADCPTCGGPVGAEDRFCEACGRDLRPPPRWLSTTVRGEGCAFCGHDTVGAEGYCERCGRRAAPGRGRTELLLGPAAAVTDRGHHRRRNEDAASVGLAGDAVAAIVCDGVASTQRADDAAHAAVDAGMDTLLRHLTEGDPPAVATARAFRDALTAVSALVRPDDHASPPSCTYVSAVAGDDGTVTVGWAGDSRAYWLAAGTDGSDCLTVDDSLAGRLAMAGVDVNPDEGSALVRWLGADAGTVEPHVVVFRPDGPGLLLLCSDGLTRYAPDAATLAGAADGSPAATARRLAQLALDAGGQDNVTVVVIALPPGTGPAGTRHHPQGETTRELRP